MLSQGRLQPFYRRTTVFRALFGLAVAGMACTGLRMAGLKAILGE